MRQKQKRRLRKDVALIIFDLLNFCAFEVGPDGRRAPHRDSDIESQTVSAFSFEGTQRARLNSCAKNTTVIERSQKPLNNSYAEIERMRADSRETLRDAVFL